MLILSSTATAIQPTPFAPDLSGLSSSSPKRSWFQNLFTFKPAPFTLWSYETIGVTEQVMQRQLASFGARVAVERLEGQTILRCRWTTSGEWRRNMATLTDRLINAPHDRQKHPVQGRDPESCRTIAFPNWRKSVSDKGCPVSFQG